MNSTYYYLKHNTYPSLEQSKQKKNKLKRRFSKLSFALGAILLLWVAYPLIKFQFFDSKKLSQNRFLVPGYSVSANSTASIPVNHESRDYTKADNWFPTTSDDSSISKVSDYSLSIPKLNIDKAKVGLTGEDLAKNLVHYGGTALPGKTGNGVIFGHSILPQFYNPKNYMAIFSILHTLEDGDQILLDYDGVTYQYQVVDMFEVKPDEIWVLDQDTNKQEITLITCTPPGTYLRRLIVKATLVPYQAAF